MEIVRAESKSKPVKIIDVDFDTLIDINKDHRFYDQEEKAILHYWSDGKTVYWRHRLVSKDVEHFQVFNGTFAKDSKSCYLYDTKLRGANNETFKALNYSYAFDGKTVWTISGRFEPAEPKTFDVCDDGFWLSEIKITLTDGKEYTEILHIPYGFAKDSKQVYYENYEGKIKILKKADPESFVSNKDGYFGWDKSNVYYGKNLLPGASPENWRVIDDKRKISTDGKYFYRLNKKISEEEAYEWINNPRL